LRLEGGSYRGKPVYFHPVALWTTTSRMAHTIAERRRVSFMSALIQLTVVALFVAAGLIARHNLRKGRGDRRGAWQLTAFVSLVAVGVWVLDNKHVSDPTIETSRFFVSQPLWAAGLLWVLYMAVEPYVRRFWPSTLVSWSRLMARHWRDPLVGRDVLLGVALGLAVHALDVGSKYAGARLGYHWTPDVPDLQELLGTSMVVARVLNQVFNAVLNAIFAGFAMVLLKMALKREWLASAVAIVLAMILAVNGTDEGSRVINFTAALIMVTLIVLTIQRLGLVSITVLFFVNFIMAGAAPPLHTSPWVFADSVLLLPLPPPLPPYRFLPLPRRAPLFCALPP